MLNHRKNIVNSIKITTVTFFSGFEKVAEVLIRKGADFNIVGENGDTALIHAASKGERAFYELP